MTSDLHILCFCICVIVFFCFLVLFLVHSSSMTLLLYINFINNMAIYFLYIVVVRSDLVCYCVTTMHFAFILNLVNVLHFVMFFFCALCYLPPLFLTSSMCRYNVKVSCNDTETLTTCVLFLFSVRVCIATVVPLFSYDHELSTSLCCL